MTLVEIYTNLVHLLKRFTSLLSPNLNRAEQPHIGIIHYACPPTIGGVESVIAQHARLFLRHGFRVTLFSGRGKFLEFEDSFVADFKSLPLADSNHPSIKSCKAALDGGELPDSFATLSDTIEAELRELFQDVDVLFAHNVCVMNKNLPMTNALRNICSSRNAPRLIGWHHDLAVTADRYQSELHSGFPWNLISEPWTDVQMKHVAVSDARRIEICSSFGLGESAVKVIPSGIESRTFQGISVQTRQLLEKANLPPESSLFLLPVRITRRKNIELALKSSLN